MKYLVLILSLVMIPLRLQAKITVEELSEVLDAHPEIIVNALQKYETAQKAAEEKEQQNNLIQHLDELNSDEGLPFVGKKNADIVLVEFFDFSCKYSKKLAPDIVSLAKNNPDIKIVFKPLSFVSPVSIYALKASLAAHKQGKFLQFYEKVFAYPNTLSEKEIDAMAKEIGLDMSEYFTDIDSYETNETAENVLSLAQKLKINGVPSLILNGEQLSVRSAEEITDKINEARNKKSANMSLGVKSEKSHTENQIEVIKQLMLK